MKIYYFASPYSHRNWLVMWYRWYVTIKWSTHLILRDFTLMEPIAMCHWQSIFFRLPSGYKFWQKRDRNFIRKCDGLILLAIPGWKESVGVTDELQYAKKLGKPIYFIRPDIKKRNGELKLVPMDRYLKLYKE